MKKVLFILCTILSLTQISAQTNRSVSESFIKALSTEKYDEAASYFDPSITQVNKNVLAMGWKQMNTMFGNFKSYYIPKNAAENETPIIIGIRFEKSTQGFGCNFNDKHQLVGFLMAPAPEDGELSSTKKTSRFREEEVVIKVKEGTLKGTITLPDSIHPHTPIALIIAGSGPTDRNGNSSLTQNNTYKLLAEALAEKGIASLRYDKRTVGASNDFKTKVAELRFTDYVEDAKNIVTFLHENKKYQDVYVLGHSEGSLIGILAAQESKVKGYVSIAGAGENIANVLERQLHANDATEILEQLKKGKEVKEVPASLQMILSPSLQPFLISWMKYDPAKEIKKLKVPILIIQGTTDLQVQVTDAQNLKKASPAATLSIIKGMNHLLKDAPEDRAANMQTYMQPNLPLNAQASNDIALFILAK